MADSTHKTRQKMTFRISLAKPRNPLVAAAMQRVAGSHRKTRGAERVAERQALQRAIAGKDEDV